MDSPEISIIVPFYNIDAYLRDCIDSILNQSFKDFELILVDDGSTDGCRAICREYKERDSRIVIYNGEHHGAGAARNLGLEKSRGKYICFVDGDDIIHPELLKVLYNAQKQYDADVAIAKFLRVRSYFKLEDNPPTEPTEPIVISEQEISDSMFKKIKYMTVWGKLYKKSVLSSLWFMDYHLSEDLEFNFRVYVRAKIIVKVQQTLYYYRLRDDSVVCSRFNLRKFDDLRALSSIYETSKREYPQYSHHALLKLYKNIFNFHYNAPKEYKKTVTILRKSVIKKTLKDLFFIKKMPRSMKYFFILSSFIPGTYFCSRKIIEWLYIHKLLNY